MDMEDLKKLSQNIRLKYKDRSRVPWPTSFKQIIIKELSSGKRLSEIIFSKGLQIMEILIGHYLLSLAEILKVGKTLW